MPKDVIVVVDIDAKPAGTESLDILLVSTEGAKDVATYRDLEVIKTDFTGKKVADMAAALFDQGKTTLADTLIRKVKIVGLEAPAAPMSRRRRQRLSLPLRSSARRTMTGTSF